MFIYKRFVFCITLIVSMVVCSVLEAAPIRIGVMYVTMGAQVAEKASKELIKLISQADNVEVVEFGMRKYSKYAQKYSDRFGNNYEMMNVMIGKEEKLNYMVSSMILTSEAQDMINITTRLLAQSMASEEYTSIEKEMQFPKADGRDNAINRSLSAAVDELLGKLFNQYAQITSVGVNNVKINRGSIFGLERGDVYSVFIEGEGAVDIFSGESSRDTINLGLMRVKDVQDKSATAEILPNGGTSEVISPGDRIRYISAADAKKMTTDIAMGLIEPFPTKRPSIQSSNSAASGAPTVSTLQMGVETSDVIVPSVPAGMVRLGIMKFESKTEDVSDKQAEAITDILTRMLANSNKIALLERDRLEAIAREHSLQLSGAVDPALAVQIGKLAGCQYILVGSVTKLEEINAATGDKITRNSKFPTSSLPTGSIGGGGLGNIMAGLWVIGTIANAVDANADKSNIETHDAHATIDARIINVETGEIVHTFSKEGSARQSITQQIVKGKESLVLEFGGLINRAITASSSLISNSVREVLASERMNIATISGADIYINRGALAGIQRGDTYKVTTNGAVSNKNAPIIIVREVYDNYAVSTLSGDASFANKGDSVEYLLLGGTSAVKKPSSANASVNSDHSTGSQEVAEDKQPEDKKRADIDALLATTKASDSAQQNITVDKSKFENMSTDPAKVVASYGLPSAKSNTLRIMHINIRKIKDKKEAYSKYVELADTYDVDYLATFHAAEISLSLKNADDARKWIAKTLDINPNYKPALDLQKKIK